MQTGLVRLVGVAIVSWGTGFVQSVSSAETRENSPAWVDALWRDHLLWRTGVLMSENPSAAEAYCRDALRLTPVHRPALEQLANHYAMQGEAALLAMTAVLALDFFPEDEAWGAILAEAEQRIQALPAAPSAEEIAEPGNLFAFYLADAQHTREVDRNLLAAEVLLRRLLTQYPRSLVVLNELGTVYALAEEWTMAAMLNRYGYRMYPENQTFLHRYLDALSRMQRGPPSLDLALTCVREHPEDAILLELAAIMAWNEDETEQLLEQLNTYGDDRYQKTFGLARAMIQRRHLALAEILAARARSIRPEAWEPVYDLAIIAALREENDAMIGYLRTLSTEVDPDQFQEMVLSGPFPEGTLNKLETP